MLKDVFWEVHQIEAKMKGNGSADAAENSVVLQISVTHKVVEEVAQGYGFTQEQMQMLMEILGDLWRTVGTVWTGSCGSSTFTGGKRGRRTLLVLAWLFYPSGMVCRFYQLVWGAAWLSGWWGYSEILWMYSRLQLVQGAQTVVGSNL